MYIHEAIRKRSSVHPFITRKAWALKFSVARTIKIFPTNTPDGMILYSNSIRGPVRGWQPREEDLTANDWTITE